MLDLTVFRNPRFSAGSGTITLAFFAMFGSLLLMTQYWQLVHGYSPLQAGIRLLPYAATMMIVAPLSARLVERQGTKRIVTVGLGLVAVGLTLLSTIASDSPYPRVIFFFMIMAAGMGMTMAPATEAVMGSLPRAKAGVGSAINDTTRQVGGALGVAVIGSVVTSVYSQRIFDLAGVFGLAPARTGDGRVVPRWRPTCGDGTRRSGGCLRRGGERQLRRCTLGRVAARCRRDPAGGGRGLAIPAVARDRSPPESPHHRRRRAVLAGACGRRLVMGGAVVSTRGPGRPRSAGIDEALLEATVQLAGEVGMYGMSMDDVANRAGVSKATIYRRWRSKEALVLDAFAHAIRPFDPIDTGSARGDLVVYLTQLGRRLETDRTSDVLPDLISASVRDDALRESLDAWVRHRRQPLTAILVRAVDRGELAPDADIDTIIDALIGAVTYRRLLSHARLDDDFVARLLSTVLPSI